MQLKLVKLTNCLGIEEKEIQVGKVTLIQGESESGKTSIIDSIRKGLKNENVRPKFVNGDKDGIVFMQFDDDLDVTRTVKSDNKSTVKINKDGMSPSAPQTYLNKLLGENDFAPIDWLKKPDKEQTEDLLRLLPIKLTSEDVTKLTGTPIDLDYSKHGLVVCEDLEKKFMEMRKEVNADIKSYKANIESDESELPDEYDPNNYRDIKLNDLFDKINEVEKVNTLIDKANSRIENAAESIDNYNSNYEERLKDLESEFNRRKKELIESRDSNIKDEELKVKSAKKYLDSNEKVDTAAMKQEVKDIEDGQSYLRLYDGLVKTKDKHVQAIESSEKYSNIINEIRSLPAKLLKNAKSPIPGMGVVDGTVTINDLPIKNLSDGAKMRLAITIAKATSKDLKLILLNGFEQLNWELQKKMFKEMQNDEYQYIITGVTDGDLTISHIEDSKIINTESGETIELE